MSETMNLPQDVHLAHPHDFFSLRRYPIVPDTCFVLMPFSRNFDPVYAAIQEGLRGVMSCTRADDLQLGRPILERILQGIATAELVIADMTGCNPNVFYELGLAHVYTKNVLLLAQGINDVPFDLRSLFCHEYKATSRGLLQLIKTVREAAVAVRKERLPFVLENRTDRTRRIVEHLDAYLASREKLRSTLFRQQGALSSLSNVGRRHPEDPEYGRLLEAERERLIRCLAEGAALQIILTPVITPWRDPKRYRERWDRLIEFLERDAPYMNRFDVVLSPIVGANLLIMGEDILFEGHKPSMSAGFAITTVCRDANVIRTRAAIFDAQFDSSRRYTLDNFGKRGDSRDDRTALRKAVLRAVKIAREGRDPLGAPLACSIRQIRPQSGAISNCPR